MNKQLYFENVLDIGKLYLDKTLNIFEDENIVFICTDIEDNYYLSICYDFREKISWILCRIDKKNLIDILLGTSDMYTPFQISTTNLIEITYENDIEESEYISFYHFNKKFLPTPGVFLKPDNDVLPYAIGLLTKDVTAKSLFENLFVYDYNINDTSENFYNYESTVPYEVNLKDEHNYQLNTKEFLYTYFCAA